MMQGELEPFITALRAELDETIAESVARPDAVDVAARAGVDRAPAHGGSVIELGLESPADPELAPFADALREVIEREATDRRMGSIPPLPAARTPRRAWGLAGAVAAAVVLGLLGRAVATGHSSSAEVDGTASLASIPSALDPDPDPGALASHDPPRSAASPTDGSDAKARVSAIDAPLAEAKDAPTESGPTPPDTVTAPEAVDAGASHETHAERLGPTSVASAAKRSVRHSQTSIDALSLDELERLAREAWRAGKLTRAASLFRQVIAAAGTSSRGELAYGDLFLVLQAAGEGEGLQRARRAYLRRYPRGRFAEDVRAAACVRSGPAEARECWADYLEHHPRGSHRDQAFRALERG